MLLNTLPDILYRPFPHSQWLLDKDEIDFFQITSAVGTVTTCIAFFIISLTDACIVETHCHRAKLLKNIFRHFVQTVLQIFTSLMISYQIFIGFILPTDYAVHGSSTSTIKIQ